MELTTFINEWIAAGNAFDTALYLDFFQPDAILDDPSVGRTFEGQEGIRQYFDTYFIGYNTQTRIVRIDLIAANNAFVEVAFSGDFPEDNIGGTFELTFRNGKIAFAKADLLH